MEIKTVYAVYFSATGRTRKVVTTLANAIAQTLELPLETVDFTLPAAREETYAFTDKDLVIFGTPTYAGKVPNKLLPFVQTGFAGNGALAVPVVTFGNRSFDNSLAELCASLENAGFHTIAAGAFACQHAFSDTLAAGRPDREDMTVLAQLGAAVVTKLGKMTEIPAPVQVDGDADAPYYRPLGLDGEPKNFLKAKPQTDRSKCTGCHHNCDCNTSCHRDACNSSLQHLIHLTCRFVVSLSKPINITFPIILLAKLFFEIFIPHKFIVSISRKLQILVSLTWNLIPFFIFFH